MDPKKIRKELVDALGHDLAYLAAMAVERRYRRREEMARALAIESILQRPPGRN